MTRSNILVAVRNGTAWSGAVAAIGLSGGQFFVNGNEYLSREGVGFAK
jgi:hypothetical protein